MIRTLPVYLKITLATNGNLTVSSSTAEIAPEGKSVIMRFDVEVDDALFESTIETGQKLVVTRPPINVEKIAADWERERRKAEELGTG